MFVDETTVKIHKMRGEIPIFVENLPGPTSKPSRNWSGALGGKTPPEPKHLAARNPHEENGDFPCGGFHGHGGTPIAGWCIRENPTKIWMITRGTPMDWKPPCEFHEIQGKCRFNQRFN